MMSITSVTIIAYSIINDNNIRGSLGEAEYSYYFVKREFIPLLEKLCPIINVNDRTGIDKKCQELTMSGRIPLLFSFTAPHNVPVGASCLIVPVFAWEYSSIPYEDFGMQISDNWVYTLCRTHGCITHSEYSASAVRRALPDKYRIKVIPSPVWDKYHVVPSPEWTGIPRRISFLGALLDSNLLRSNEKVYMGNPKQFESRSHSVELSGMVFTSIFNPVDGRKNWRDTITAFVWAFRNHENIILVLKLLHSDTEIACKDVLYEIQQLLPYRCRIVAIASFLDDISYDELLRATTFVVNSSHGEGQCLPLMEFMSAGKPAITPDHTAMSDYIDENNALIVKSSLEWTAWPHDPRQLLRCMRYRINWESLLLAFQQAEFIASNDRDRYLSLSKHAANRLYEHCSSDVVLPKLKTFIDETLQSDNNYDEESISPHSVRI